MLLYVLICLSLSLAGVAGLQMLYMYYMEAGDRQRKKRLTELECETRKLRHDLLDAKKAVSEQKARLVRAGIEIDDESWAEVIEEI
ncbi:MAG: hypothetical protein ABI999_17635 [Acidobacteriota bacterium]